MTKRVRSAKGEMVDFDLMKIKEQMAATPVLPDVQARQDFIDRRLRRRLRKVKQPTPTPEAEKEASEFPFISPELPGTEDLSKEPEMIHEVAEEPKETEVKKTTTRQKARPKPKEDNTEGEADVQTEGNP